MSIGNGFCKKVNECLLQLPLCNEAKAKQGKDPSTLADAA